MSEELSDFFKLLAKEKKQKKEEFNSIVGDLGLNSLFEEFNSLKKKNKEKKEVEKKKIEAFESFVFSEKIELPVKRKKVKEIIIEKIEDEQESIIIEEENVIEEVEEPKENLEEKSLGLVAEPSDVKQQNDPLTPINQNFATLEDLQKHYSLFLTRIQQQLSTLGGGGETRLEFLDDIDRNSAKTNDYYLKYDVSIDKWIGAPAGGAGSQNLDTTLSLGNTSNFGMSVGVVTATSFFGSGTNLTGIVTSINAGSGITIDQSTGKVTITATGSGGGLVGLTIRDEGNVVGTANSITALNFVGENITATASGTISTITVATQTYVQNAGIATYATTSGYASTAGIATVAQGLVGTPNINVGVITATSLSLGNANIISGIITTNTTSETVILSLDSSIYRSATYQVQITEGTNYNMTTINAIHDGSVTYMSEYGTINQPVGIATFSTDINSGFLRLLAYPNSINTTTFKIMVTTIQT